jgi:hypothetical protein
MAAIFNKARKFFTSIKASVHHLLKDAFSMDAFTNKRAKWY